MDLQNQIHTSRGKVSADSRFMEEFGEISNLIYIIARQVARRGPDAYGLLGGRIEQTKFR